MNMSLLKMKEIFGNNIKSSTFSILKPKDIIMCQIDKTYFHNFYWAYEYKDDKTLILSSNATINLFLNQNRITVCFFEFEESHIIRNNDARIKKVYEEYNNSKLVKVSGHKIDIYNKISLIDFFGTGSPFAKKIIYSLYDFQEIKYTDRAYSLEF